MGQTDWMNSRIYKELKTLGKKKDTPEVLDLDKVFNNKFPNPDIDIFTEIECIYTATLLKRKKHSKEDLS